MKTMKKKKTIRKESPSFLWRAFYRFGSLPRAVIIIILIAVSLGIVVLVDHLR